MKKIAVVVVLVEFLFFTAVGLLLAENPRCVGRLELPDFASKNKEILGKLVITNTTGADLWWQIYYTSDAGVYDPEEDRLYGPPKVETETTFSLIPQQTGWFTATVKIEGKKGVCTVISKRLEVLGHYVYLPLVVKSQK